MNFVQSLDKDNLVHCSKLWTPGVCLTVLNEPCPTLHLSRRFVAPTQDCCVISPMLSAHCHQSTLINSLSSAHSHQPIDINPLSPLTSDYCHETTVISPLSSLQASSSQAALPAATIHFHYLRPLQHNSALRLAVCTQQHSIFSCLVPSPYARFCTCNYRTPNTGLSTAHPGQSITSLHPTLFR